MLHRRSQVSREDDEDDRTHQELSHVSLLRRLKLDAKIRRGVKNKTALGKIRGLPGCDTLAAKTDYRRRYIVET